MVKILYALCGEGYGHAMRSKAIIDELIKRHEVKILCGGKAYPFMAGHFKNVEKIYSFHTFYRNNNALAFQTILINLLKLPQHIKSFFKAAKTIAAFKPDIIISDFEQSVNYLAFLFGKPNLLIENESTVTCSKIEFPKKYWLDFVQSYLVIKFFVPKASHRFIVSYFFPELKKGNKKNCTYITPLLKKEVLGIKHTAEKHVLVYQTSKTNQLLLNVLKFIDEKFIVYGFEADKKDGNMTFRQFNEKQFYNDLASAKAVITNGGFTLISEAIYLKKPILSIPIRGQFEQIVNALYLQKLGYGKFIEAADKDGIMCFLRNLKQYEEKLSVLKYESKENIIAKIENKIMELVKNN